MRTRYFFLTIAASLFLLFSPFLSFDNVARAVELSAPTSEGVNLLQQRSVGRQGSTLNAAPLFPDHGLTPENQELKKDNEEQKGSSSTQADFPPEPREKSSIEKFFSQPSPLVGEAVSEKSGPKEEFVDREFVDREFADPRFDSALPMLFARDKELSSAEKVQIYQQMDVEKQKKYLLSLPVTERKDFLRMLGEEARWYSEDLKAQEVSRDLSQFGYDFFATTADGGFIPEMFAPVGPDYVVGPGDVLVVNVWGNIDGTYEVVVDRSGDVVLPKVGAIHIWGQTFSQAQETIRKQISKYFTNFELNVTMGKLRSIQVYLVGEVASPGTYTVSSLSTVLNALSAAGGPSRTGSLRNVQLVRNGQVAANIDFYDFFLSGDRSRDVRLQSGDTIFVPVAGSLVGVAGDVRRPAVYELKDGEKLKDVLDMAGGINATAYLGKIQVERVEAHSKKVVLDLNLRRHEEAGQRPLDFVLQDHDLIKISSIAPASGQYVLLKGYAARPGRYQFVEGMRLADLIAPYDNLLPYYYPKIAEILRLKAANSRPEKLTVDLEKALAGDPANNVLLQEYDEVRLFSRTEMEESPEVHITGAVLQPGAYPLYEGMTVKDLITTAGNIRRSAFLEEAEITRFIPSGKKTRTERFIVNLGKALDADPQHNVVLLADDHLFVRSIPDYGKKMTVTLKGEVLFPGIYSISEGETLSSVLERAGGFTDKAYLRGAFFEREDLKELQSRRLKQLIFEEEQAIAEASSEIARGALSDEELKSAQSLLVSRQQMLEKLKETPVTGRLVVRLGPLEELTGSDYDVQLIDGDTLTVPKNPLSVTVMGEVYNQTSLTYKPGQTVSYYLAKVGGPEESADADNMFIVRADGTVFSKQQAGMGFKWDSDNNRWVVGGFNTTELYPGDAILVPREYERISIMREVKDISVIFYQMALGAAAVASF